MFCSKCGAPMGDNDLFCKKCGAKAGAGEIPQAAHQPQQSYAPQQQPMNYQQQPTYVPRKSGANTAKKKFPLWALITITAVAALGIVAALWFFVFAPKQGPAAEETVSVAEPFAADYVEMLRSGTYQYSYIVPYEGMEMIVTEAAKGGSTVYRVSQGEASSRIMQQDGKFFAIDDATGQFAETTPEKNVGGDLDFSAMTFIDAEEQDGKVFEKYSMLRNEQEREFTFVFENGTLIGIKPSYIEDDAPYFKVTEFTGTVEETILVLPEKTTLAINEIAEGTYTGTLSGDSYTSTGDEDDYSISPDISIPR